MSENNAEWPERPTEWPAVMTELEACLYLRLDYLSPASAKRSLRFIRRNGGLPDAGRLGRNVIFLKSTLDRWLESRENRDSGKSPVSSLSRPPAEGTVDSMQTDDSILNANHGTPEPGRSGVIRTEKRA